MRAPTVSVIIPSYNHFNYLRRRIESVLNQTFTDFEVIILDDCSSDGSASIIGEYYDNPRVSKIILNNENQGSPFKQWKRGLEHANGDWIWIAESDDYADERFLELALAAGDAHPNVGLVYCDSKIVGKKIGPEETFADIKNKKFSTDRWSGNYTNRGISELEDYLLSGGTINNTSAVLFRKKSLFEANPFDITFRYIGDMYAFVKVLAISDIAYVGESLNYYRDPFSNKHKDKIIHYFYEQFLLLDWVYRNTNISREKFFRIFYKNTRNSVYRGWNKIKMNIYLDLFAVNRSLFLKSLSNNLIAPFKEWQNY